MENFFGGLIASKSSKLAGSGQNPTTIGNIGNSMARVKAKMKLPTEISAQQVIDLERQMGQVDAELELVDDIISMQEKLLGKAVDLHGKNTKWAAVTMKADQRLREIESNHDQTVARYTLGAATTQAYRDGFTEAYQVSAEIFS
ncbi:MAG: hypothetical protein ACOVOV_11585 [Dolichospermum sp.]|jgi:hypothetical protein